MASEEAAMAALVEQILSAGRTSPIQSGMPVPAPPAKPETEADKLVAEIMNAGR
jgi:hypothetical protein